jgi:hypothetical protein
MAVSVALDAAMGEDPLVSPSYRRLAWGKTAETDAKKPLLEPLHRPRAFGFK